MPAFLLAGQDVLVRAALGGVRFQGTQAFQQRLRTFASTQYGDLNISTFLMDYQKQALRALIDAPELGITAEIPASLITQISERKEPIALLQLAFKRLSDDSRLPNKMQNAVKTMQQHLLAYRAWLDEECARILRGNFEEPRAQDRRLRVPSAASAA
ncbi:MAG: hypothetical protein DHS20C10_01350 [marine bacterium B5-7]|nr:MAG: hypothetical protein DHS20C10_01350 [marine bacterium B5-7]